MPSAEHPLLGTEVVRMIRAKDTSVLICGLSANDSARGEFYRSGADGFMTKPFPCKNDCLKIELMDLLSRRSSNNV